MGRASRGCRFRLTGCGWPRRRATGRSVRACVVAPHRGVHISRPLSPPCAGIWEVAAGCTNTLSLRGHKNGVLSVAWLPRAHGDLLVTASADTTGGVWDAEAGVRLRTLAGHSRIVNDVSPARSGAPLVVSASDDCTARVWDARSRTAVATLRGERFPLLACAFAGDAGSVFLGGVEGRIRQHDLRKVGGSAATSSVLLTLEGHTECVSGLAVSPDGTHLLSFAFDNTCRMWDVRPFAPAGRAGRVLHGAVNNFELNAIRCAWAPGGDVVAAGSADRRACIWDVETGGLRVLGGHLGVATCVAFSPTQPVFASAGTDKKAWVGEF